MSPRIRKAPAIVSGQCNDCETVFEEHGGPQYECCNDNCGVEFTKAEADGHYCPDCGSTGCRTGEDVSCPECYSVDVELAATEECEECGALRLVGGRCSDCGYSEDDEVGDEDDDARAAR